VIGVDGTIYVGSDDYKFYAVRPDGSRKWSSRTSGTVESPAAIGAGGTLYFGCDDQHVSPYPSMSNLYAMNPDGTQRWVLAIAGGSMRAPVIGVDGTIYISTRKTFYAVKPDGTLKWTFAPSQFGALSSPAIGAENTIYLGSSYYYTGAHSQSGRLYAFHPDGTLN